MIHVTPKTRRESATVGKLRVLAGDRKGKKLFSVSGLNTRPTSSRVREAVFNIITGKLSHAVVLDLYAGTGILGIEALSRGARFALFVDYSSASLAVIRRNIAACKFDSRSRVLNMDIRSGSLFPGTPERSLNLVFMDPPYNKGFIYGTLLRLRDSRVLAPDALIVVEHAAAESPPIDLAGFHLNDQRKYGKTLVSFIDYTI